MITTTLVTRRPASASYRRRKQTSTGYATRQTSSALAFAWIRYRGSSARDVKIPCRVKRTIFLVAIPEHDAQPSKSIRIIQSVCFVLDCSNLTKNLVCTFLTYGVFKIVLIYSGHAPVQGPRLV
jgi:hypothetical protein